MRMKGQGRESLLIVKFNRANDAEMKVSDFTNALTILAKRGFPLNFIKLVANDETKVTSIGTDRER